jgi:hypothetical protein
LACGVIACSDGKTFEFSEDIVLTGDGLSAADLGLGGSNGTGSVDAGGGDANTPDGNGGSGAGGSGGSDGGTAGTSGNGGTASTGGTVGVSGAAGDGGTGGTSGNGGANLITNPDFESGVWNWSAAFGGELAASAAQAHGGAQSVVVTERTQTFHGAHYDLTSIAELGASYSFGAFAKLGGAASDTLNLTAFINCEGQSSRYIQIDTAAASDSDWTELTGELTLPASFQCSLNQVLVYVEGAAAGVDIYVDDVSAMQTADAPVVTNLITNSDFESGAQGWTAGFGGTLAVSTTQAHHGLQSVVVTDRTETYQGPHFDLTSSVEVGSTYSLSAFAKLGGASTNPLRLTARILCEGLPDEYRLIDTTAGSDSAWRFLSGDLVLPAVGCTLTSLLVYVEGADIAVDIYVDDVWGALSAP